MLNNMKSILSYSYRKIPEEYREEFSTKKIKQNFARTKNIAIFLLVFNLILIIIDINNFRSLWGEIPAYKNTFYLQCKVHNCHKRNQKFFLSGSTHKPKPNLYI